MVCVAAFLDESGRFYNARYELIEPAPSVTAVPFPDAATFSDFDAFVEALNAWVAAVSESLGGAILPISASRVWARPRLVEADQTR